MSTGRNTIAAVETLHSCYCLVAARPAAVAPLEYLVIACAVTKYLSRATALNSQHIDPPGRLGNYCQLVSLCLLRLRCTRLPLSMSPTALTATATGGIVQVRIVDRRH